jgi:hypothetical protein
MLHMAVAASTASEEDGRSNNLNKEYNTAAHPTNNRGCWDCFSILPIVSAEIRQKRNGHTYGE